MTKNKPTLPTIDEPSKKQFGMTISPYSDKELEMTPDLEEKINKLMAFFDKAGINYSKFNAEDIPKLDIGKRQAYPNNDQYMYIPGQHNTQKWMQAVREIFAKESNGDNRVNSIRRVTSGWNIMETFDFLNWLKFHEAGDHMKYKFAQLWYENGDPGYFLQIKPDPVKDPEPQHTGRDIDFAREESHSNAERKQIIEKQRNKIIGRLDSAEKLLRSPDGQVFSGKEFETLLEAIYQLKKKIQLVNKVSTATRLYEDMIVREANILNRNGFVKAASVLYSVAQTPAASGEQAKGTPGGTEIIAPTSPDDPSGAGHPGPPSGGAATVGQPPGNVNTPQSEPNDTEPLGISEFLKGMDTAKFSPTDDASSVEDDLEVEDTIDVNDIDNELLVTEAQATSPIDEPMTASPAPAALDPSPVAPPKVTQGPKTNKPATEEPLEVTEDDIKPGDDNPSPVASDFDAKVNAVFADITVADVVAKLEDLAKFYKTREAPRQLGIVDMMLDSLGLASYFPSLAEATNKSLESNNYISTRVEDILSKLRGAMVGKNIDLKGGNEPDRPEVAGIKNKLKSDDEKEKTRKQQRKDLAAEELSGKEKETPEIEIEEDLGAPTKAPGVPPRAPPPTAKAPVVPPRAAPPPIK